MIKLGSEMPQIPLHLGGINQNLLDARMQKFPIYGSPVRAI